MKEKLLFLLLFLISNVIVAQQPSFKEQSMEQFKKENYPLAINLMEQALSQNPNDAEVYYYLGMFNHYNAYDSRPLKGYDNSYSEKVFSYLDMALKLNPNFGDAKYFYFSQCCAVALEEYQNNRLDKVKLQYERAYKRGVIPDWAIELGKNMLNLCDSNAILFTHGDFTLNICLFVQLHYDYRKDITIVPLVLLESPSFTLALSNNVSSNIIRGLKTGLTKEQILDMHPYAWDTTTVSLPVPDSLIIKYSLSNGYKMDWLIEPDLTSNRGVAKINGERPHEHTYLSPTRAVLLNIIETNNWERPIYFTNTFETYYLAGLDKYFQSCGLISKLLPIKTDKTQWKVNVQILEKLVFETNLEKLKTIISNDQPRASGIIYLYGISYLTLADYYQSNNRKNEVQKIIDKYKQNLMIGFNSELEKKYLDGFEAMKK